MNVQVQDENFVVTSNFQSISISEFNTQTQPEGDLNLFQDEELTVWKLTPSGYTSTLRIGNFAREENGQIIENSNSNIYPAMLLYDSSQKYPMLDVGIQPDGTGQKAVISFKKLENEQQIEYASIELDQSKKLNIDAQSTIIRYVKDEEVFEENVQIGDGYILQSTIENGSQKNINGIITNQDLLATFPKPIISTLNIEPITTAIVAGVIIGNIIGVAITVGAGVAIWKLFTGNSSNNVEFTKQSLAVNDYEKDLVTNTITYKDSAFLMSDQLQFNGQQFEFKRNNENYITLTSNNLQLNPDKCNGSGSSFITIDASGNVGIESVKTFKSSVKCVLKIEDSQVQMLKSVNIKNVYISKNIVKIVFLSKMDIYEPRITIVSSKNENVKCKIISDIIAETDFFEFEVSDVESETILSINVQ